MGLEDFVKKHLVDSTAILASSHPVFCALETFGSGMTVHESLSARLLATGLVYGGLGLVYAQGRTLWMWGFGVGKDASERKKQVYDFGYGIAYNLIVSPAIYRISATDDWEKIGIATLGATVVGAIAGPVFGYAIDGFEECLGIAEQKRLPQCIQSRSPRVKKAIVGVSVLASVASMVGVYALAAAYKS